MRNRSFPEYIAEQIVSADRERSSSSWAVELVTVVGILAGVGYFIARAF